MLLLFAFVLQVGSQEQESLSISSTDHLEITTEDTPGFGTALEITPSSPATESIPEGQQDTTTQSSKSLPLSDLEPQLESELNPSPPPQQQTEPTVQEVDDDATSIPACYVTVPGLSEDTITEDNLGLMPPLETRDIEPKMTVETDIPHKSGLPEIAAPAPCLPFKQEIDDNSDRDTGLTHTEEMEGFDNIEEELAEIREELDTSVRLEGSDISTIKELESATESQIREECMRNDRSEVTGVKVVDLEDVPQVHQGLLTSVDETSSATGIQDPEDLELHLREESSQAAGEDVSLPMASLSDPTHQSSVHPGPTGEHGMTQGPLFLSNYVSDTDKSPAPVQHLKPWQDLAFEANHIALAVTSDSQPSESKCYAEETASMQYLTIDAHTTTPSTENTANIPEDRLEVSAGTEELESPAEDSSPTCTSILAPEVPEGPQELPGDSVGSLDRPISIWQTLKPAMYGLSTVLCLTAAMQEHSLLFVLGLYLVVHCF